MTSFVRMYLPRLWWWRQKQMADASVMPHRSAAVLFRPTRDAQSTHSCSPCQPSKQDCIVTTRLTLACACCPCTLQLMSRAQLEMLQCPELASGDLQTLVNASAAQMRMQRYDCMLLASLHAALICHMLLKLAAGEASADAAGRD